MERLLVYGPLAPGKRNRHVPGDLSGSWEPTFVRGHPVEAGRGAALGSVPFVADDQRAEVEGPA